MTNNVVEHLLEELEEVTREICEKCCKYMEKYGDTDELVNKHCESCPMMRITY